MKIYFVAGEPSGDMLAAGLMKELRHAEPGVEFYGVGGQAMAEMGLKSLFDIEEISVMGFFEIVPRLAAILRRIKQTTDDIERVSPDVLVTVDSWGFVSAVLARLRKHGSKVPVVHYVAPQVWAWKKGRAKNVAQAVDMLMMLMPHEGRYFEKYGLRCEFVGHPVVERMSSATAGDGSDFRKTYGIGEDVPIVCVLPGSRRSEVKKLIPVFTEALGMLRERVGDFAVVVPTVPGVEKRVRGGFAAAGVEATVVTGTEGRYAAFGASSIAIASSGTVSLELAMSGVPHLIAYKFNALTNMLADLLVKVRFANLINLLADKEIIPEFVLGKCRPELIAGCAERLMSDKSFSETQVNEAREIVRTLRLPDKLPSQRAAELVLEMARK